MVLFLLLVRFSSLSLCGYCTNESLDFGSVEFIGAEATTWQSSGDASGAAAIDIEDNLGVITNVTISGSTVTIGYVEIATSDPVDY